MTVGRGGGSSVEATEREEGGGGGPPPLLSPAETAEAYLSRIRPLQFREVPLAAGHYFRCELSRECGHQVASGMYVL